MIKTVRRGEFQAFTAQLSCYSGVSVKLSHILLMRSGFQGVAALCRIADMNKADFLSILILSHRYRSGRGDVDISTINRAVDYYNSLEDSAARETIKAAAFESAAIH